MGRDRRRSTAGRDEGGFIALPWAVTDSAAYQRLSLPARALLIEFARQYNGKAGNNGRLLASRKYLAGRGWKSVDVATRAKRELLAAGFIHQTVMGHRPNKASWYAVTWYALDRLDGYDAGAAETFVRSAYKNASLTPPHGTDGRSIAPPHGTEGPRTVPSHGAMRAVFAHPSVPSDGHHLDMPSIAAPIQPAATTTKTAGGPKRRERQTA